MPYLSPQTLINYMLEMNKPLTLDELGDRFDSVSKDDILQSANALEMNGLVDELEPLVWEVSDKAKQMLKEQEERKLREEEKATKEYQKLQLEITDLVDRVSDYATVKSRATWGFYLSIATVIISILALLLTIKYKG